MQTKAATALYDYWTRQRGEQALPLRSSIEPADIAPILPDVFILEHSRLHDPRFRLAGTRLCAQFARELKGTDFDALFAPDVAEEIRNRLRHSVVDSHRGERRTQVKSLCHPLAINNLVSAALNEAVKIGAPKVTGALIAAAAKAE